MVSQDIEELLPKINKTSKDFAGFIKSPIYNEKTHELEKYRYGMRYTEFISPMIKAIQEEDVKVEKISTKLNEKNDVILDINGNIQYTTNDTINSLHTITGFYYLTYNNLYSHIPVISVQLVNPITTLCMNQITSLEISNCLIYCFNISGNPFNPEKIIIKLS